MIGISSNNYIPYDSNNATNTYKRDDDARGFEQWKALTVHDDNTALHTKTLLEYTVFNTVGSDLIVDGDFSSGLIGPGKDWRYNNWLNASIITSGALVLDGNTASCTHNAGPLDQHGYLFQLLGTVTTTNPYRLKFSMIADNNNEVLEFVVRDKDSGDEISEYVYFELSTSRTEKEYLVYLTAGSTNSELRFYIENEDGTVAIDNIEFQAVNVTVHDPYDYFKFEYNYSSTPKVVALGEPYLDVYGNTYPNSVTIPPYRSITLFKAEGVLGIDDLHFFQKEIEIYKIISNRQEANLRIMGTINQTTNAIIYDITGKLITLAQLNIGDENIIPFKYVPQGIYIIRFQTSDKIIAKKFIWY